MADMKTARAGICEIPFTSATALDATFNNSGPGKWAIKKHRQAIREFLDPGIRFSVGRAGMVQLNSIATVTCVATAGRWNLQDGMQLAGAYKKAGLTDLIGSPDYQDALDRVRQALQSAIRGSAKAASSIMDLLPQCLAMLTRAEPVVHRVTASLHQIVVKVNEENDQIRRYPGRFIRSDGAKALIAVDTGEREELRSADSAYLRSLGIHESGAPFVMHQISWSPDSTMQVFFPALDLDMDQADKSNLEARLKNAERPLGAPPEELSEGAA